jgi:hypothetical protein
VAATSPTATCARGSTACCDERSVWEQGDRARRTRTGDLLGAIRAPADPASRRLQALYSHRDTAFHWWDCRRSPGILVVSGTPGDQCLEGVLVVVQAVAGSSPVAQPERSFALGVGLLPLGPRGSGREGCLTGAVPNTVRKTKLERGEGPRLRDPDAGGPCRSSRCWLAPADAAEGAGESLLWNVCAKVPRRNPGPRGLLPGRAAVAGDLCRDP